MAAPRPMNDTIPSPYLPTGSKIGVGYVNHALCE